VKGQLAVNGSGLVVARSDGDVGVLEHNRQPSISGPTWEVLEADRLRKPNVVIDQLSEREHPLGAFKNGVVSVPDVFHAAAELNVHPLPAAIKADERRPEIELAVCIPRSP